MLWGIPEARSCGLRGTASRDHGQGMLALRIDEARPGRLRNLTPIVPECTIDIVQTRDGSIVFSDAGAIYRLVPA